MKFTTLIPLRFNDGTAVPAERLEGFVNDLAIRFGGCSEEGVTKGQWIDPQDSQLYRDESQRVSVVCDSSLLWDAQQSVVMIGRALGQRAMYFEVRDYDGVHILEVTPE